MVHTVPYYPTSGFPLNLVSLDCHSWGFLWYHGYYVRKATKNRVWNRMVNKTLKMKFFSENFNCHNLSWVLEQWRPKKGPYWRKTAIELISWNLVVLRLSLFGIKIIIQKKLSENLSHSFLLTLNDWESIVYYFGLHCFCF